jgi:hypothetical protein
VLASGPLMDPRASSTWELERVSGQLEWQSKFKSSFRGCFQSLKISERSADIV